MLQIRVHALPNPETKRLEGNHGHHRHL